MKKILGVSLVALMAVSTARADIASKAYVDQEIGDKTGWSSAYNGATNVSAALAAIAGAASGDASAIETKLGAGTNGYDINAKSLQIQGKDVQTELIGAAPEGNADSTDANKIVIVGDDGKFDVSSYTVGSAAEATVETTGVASNTTTLPTTAQVKSYVDNAASASNFVHDGITDGVTNKAPSENAVNDALALKQNIQIGAAGDAGKAVVVASDGKIGMSTNTLGDAAYKNVTGTYSSTGTDPITGTGVAAALGTLGTMASETASNYTKTADLDSSVSAVSGKVVTAISMADGVLSTTTADPLSVTSYSVGHDGKYVLTAVVSGGAITGYKWELITRNGNETEPGSGY